MVKNIQFLGNILTLMFIANERFKIQKELEWRINDYTLLYDYFKFFLTPYYFYCTLSKIFQNT